MENKGFNHSVKYECNTVVTFAFKSHSRIINVRLTLPLLKKLKVPNSEPKNKKQTNDMR